VSRDLRKYTRNTQVRLIAGFLVLVFLVGDGLIYVFYGKGAALVGLVCILGALLPVGIIVLFLWITEKIVEDRS
jgi:hypothetical protein